MSGIQALGSRSRSTLFSSQIEVVGNALIPPYFKYGSHPFAHSHPLESFPGHLTAQYVRRTILSGEVPNAAEAVEYYWIRCIPEQDSVYGIRKLGRWPAVLVLSGLGSGAPTVSFNKAYELWSNLRWVRFQRPADHLESLLEMSLLRSGIIPLHAASFAHEDSAHLLLAPPNTGKSRSIMGLMRMGFDFVAEDVTLVGRRQVFPVPFTTTLTQRESLSSRQRVLSLLFKGVGSLQTVFQALQIPFKAPRPAYRLGNIYLLRRSHKSAIRPAHDREAISRLVLMWNRMEFGYYRDRLLTAYLTHNTELPTIDALMRVERDGLETMLSEASSVYEVDAPDAQQLTQLIASKLV